MYRGVSCPEPRSLRAPSVWMRELLLRCVAFRVWLPAAACCCPSWCHSLPPHTVPQNTDGMVYRTLSWWKMSIDDSRKFGCSLGKDSVSRRRRQQENVRCAVRSFHTSPPVPQETHPLLSTYKTVICFAIVASTDRRSWKKFMCSAVVRAKHSTHHIP